MRRAATRDLSRAADRDCGWGDFVRRPHARCLGCGYEGAPVLCLDAGTVARCETGASPLADKDLIVAETANFAMGARPVPTLWWHVREAIIDGAYRTFWSEASRAAVFDQIASRMRPCPPRSGP